MPRLTRRRLLEIAGVATVGSLAGCSALTGRPDADPGTQTDADSPENTGESTGTPSLTDWERSTDCEGEHDRLHDSVISVARVTTDLEDAYVPIQFDDLPPDEKAILRTVTEDGGYATCDPAEAFHRFLDRVLEHLDRQSDTTRIYLERAGTYYGLYVERSDEVFTY